MHAGYTEPVTTTSTRSPGGIAPYCLYLCLCPLHACVLCRPKGDVTLRVVRLADWQLPCRCMAGRLVFHTSSSCACPGMWQLRFRVTLLHGPVWRHEKAKAAGVRRC